MSNVETCPVGTLAKLAAAKTEIDRLRDHLSRSNKRADHLGMRLRDVIAERDENERCIAVWRGRTQRAETERDALHSLLNQFNDMTDADLIAAAYWIMADYARGQA